MKTIDLDDSIECIDIKKNPLTEHQLELLFQRTQSYEALFNKRAQRYKQRGLKDQVLSDTDYGELLSDHYTFLKRPVLVYEEHIFVGNAAKTVAEAKAFLDEQ